MADELQKVEETVKTKVTVLLDKHHLILYVVLVVSLFIGNYLYSEWRASRADERAAVAEAKYEAAKEANNQFQQQTQAQIKAIADQNVMLQAQVTTLTKAISDRNIALLTQKKEVHALPPTALAEKWGSVAGESAPSIDTQGNFLASLPLVRKSVDALLTVPVLEADKKDLQTQIATQETVIQNDAKALGLEQSAHVSDKQTCVLQVAAKDAEIVKVKADAAKAKRKWGVIGTIIGFIGRGFVHF